MRAILLEANPDVTNMLACAFDDVDIALKCLKTLAAVQRAVTRAGSDDFIIVDCSLDRPEDRTNCERVVRQVIVDVHIVYNPGNRSHDTFRRHITRIARGDIKWLPATVSYLDLLGVLRGLRDEALKARVRTPRKPLTAHQEEVWALLAAGKSHDQIAKALGSKPGTVKTDIVRVKEKLGLTSTEELKMAFRWRVTP